MTPRRPTRWSSGAGQSGMTLVEVLTVVVVIGILVTVAAPRMTALKIYAARAEVKTMLRHLNSLALSAERKTGEAPVPAGPHAGPGWPGTTINHLVFDSDTACATINPLGHAAVDCPATRFYYIYARDNASQEWRIHAYARPGRVCPSTASTSEEWIIFKTGLLCIQSDAVQNDCAFAPGRCTGPILSWGH